MIKVKFDPKALDRMIQDFGRLEEAIRKEVVWSSNELRAAMRDSINKTVYDSNTPGVYHRSYAIRRAIKTETKSAKYRIVRAVFIDSEAIKRNNPEQPIPSRWGRKDWANPKGKDYSFFVHEGRGYQNVPPPPFNIKRKWRTAQPLANTRRPFVENLYRSLINGDTLLRRFEAVIKKVFRGSP